MKFHETAIELVRNSPSADADAMVSTEASARANRGRCLLALGRTQEALVELRQVVTLHRLFVAANSNPKRKRRLGMSLINLASAEVNEPGGEVVALSLLREALSAAKEVGDIHLQQIVVTNLNTIGVRLTEDDIAGLPE